MRNEIIKQCLNNSSFVDTIVTLLNQIFETGNSLDNYPNIWKTDIMKPVDKEGSTNKESNYRGTSLSSCLQNSLMI